jgi:hypothetical protein
MKYGKFFFRLLCCYDQHPTNLLTPMEGALTKDENEEMSNINNYTTHLSNLISETSLHIQLPSSLQ